MRGLTGITALLGYGWMSPLSQTCDGPFLNVSEGVFMYLYRGDVKSLVLELQSEFPGSELVWEVFNDLWLKKPLKGLVNFKMRKGLHLGKDATFPFQDQRAERWKRGIRESRLQIFLYYPNDYTSKNF